MHTEVVAKTNRKRVATLVKDVVAAITSEDVMQSPYEEANKLKELKGKLGWESGNTDDLTDLLGKMEKQMLMDAAVDAAMCAARIDEAQRIKINLGKEARRVTGAFCPNTSKLIETSESSVG